ncbi:hypothetical protein BD560DRAFT_408899 [Blakeslea trispora]|nr:hypothetical protein BD560DRAFT_408899 [Blakeslea trispora]
MSPLIDTIVNYTTLLNQCTSNKVASWTPEFIRECTDWCVYLETELAVLEEDVCEDLLRSAQAKTSLDIPSRTHLLDALHQFFYSLLNNPHLPNQVYLYLLKHYQFLTIPQKDLLLHDLAQLSTQAATEAVLLDIVRELEAGSSPESLQHQ